MCACVFSLTIDTCAINTKMKSTNFDPNELEYTGCRCSKKGLKDVLCVNMSEVYINLYQDPGDGLSADCGNDEVIRGGANSGKHIF